MPQPYAYFLQNPPFPSLLSSVRIIHDQATPRHVLG